VRVGVKVRVRVGVNWPRGKNGRDGTAVNSARLDKEQSYDRTGLGTGSELGLGLRLRSGLGQGHGHGQSQGRGQC